MIDRLIPAQPCQHQAVEFRKVPGSCLADLPIVRTSRVDVDECCTEADSEFVRCA